MVGPRNHGEFVLEATTEECLEKEPGVNTSQCVQIHRHCLHGRFTVLAFAEALADELLPPVALGVNHFKLVSDWLQDVYPPSPDEQTLA